MWWAPLTDGLEESRRYWSPLLSLCEPPAFPSFSILSFLTSWCLGQVLKWLGQFRPRQTTRGDDLTWGFSRTIQLWWVNRYIIKLHVPQSLSFDWETLGLESLPCVCKAVFRHELRKMSLPFIYEEGSRRLENFLDIQARGGPWVGRPLARHESSGVFSCFILTLARSDIFYICTRGTISTQKCFY